MSHAPLDANPTDFWHLGIMADLRERRIPLAALTGAVPAAATVIGVHAARRPGRLVALELHREKAGSVASTMDIDVKVNGVSVLGADAADKLRVAQAAGDDQRITRSPKGAEGYTEDGGLIINPGDVIKAEVVDNENGDAAGLFLDAVVVY